MACVKNMQKHVLRDNFCTYPSLTPCNLCLTESVLFVKIANKIEPENIVISDIVGCHSLIKKAEKLRKDTKDVSAYLRIFYYPLKINTGIINKQSRRDRQTAKFVMCKFETYEDNAATINKWRTAILWLMRGRKLIYDEEIQIPGILPKSPKLLFIVNPHSGPGRASSIFKEQVLPILQESDIHYELLVTDKADCARNYVKMMDLSKWNGIVVVSGDGLLFEIYNGLMERRDWEAAVKTPVGVIPGGSGNGLARAINHATGEPYDTTIVTASALNIVSGRTSPMDLVCVHTTRGAVYSFLSVGWGLMADIDIESEKLRAIGEARFTVWAVIRALGLRTYKGKLSYLPVYGYEPSASDKPLGGPKMKRSKTMDSHTYSHPIEISNHNTEAIFRSKSFGNEKSEIPNYNSKVELLTFNYSGEFNHPNGSSVNLDSTIVNHFHDDDCHHDSYSKWNTTAPKSSSIPPLTDPVPDDWVVIDGDFILVYVSHQTHLSTDVMFAPDAKLDDGIMWLVIIRSGVSRVKVIHFLSSLQNGDHVHIPYVDVIPIHAFRLEPFQDDGVLTVDGESIPCGTIQAEVLPSIARIMTR